MNAKELREQYEKEVDQVTGEISYVQWLESRLALAERKVKAFDSMKDYMGLMHDCYFALDASQPKEKASTGR